MARKVHEIAFQIASKLKGNFTTPFSQASTKIQLLKHDINDLNQQYKKGNITADQFAQRHAYLSRKLQTAQQQLKQYNQSLQQTQKMWSSPAFGNMMARGGALALGGIGAGAIGAGFLAGASLKKAMSYEQQLSSIQALGNITAEEMKQIDALAMRMGASTKYSSLQAAQGIEELLKSGFTPAAVQAGGLEAALNLATAGGLELADAAVIMADGLNGFKKDGMKAADVANILAGAANASSTDVEQLKYGLSMVGPVADGIGVSFKEVNATLAAFSNNALKGSDAGTSLKTFLANVQPNTDKAAELFKKYGLTLKDGSKNVFFANGQLKDMSEVAEELQQKFKHLTDQQRTAAFFDLFGSDAVRAANILYKEGAEGIEKMYEEMAKTTALDVAKKKMDNAAGAVEQFQGAMETLQISALKPTLPLIKDIVLLFADLAERYTPLLTEKMESLSQTMKKYLDPYLNDIKNVKVETQAEFKFKQSELMHEQPEVPTISQTVELMWNDAMASFNQWLSNGGQQQINEVSSTIIGTLSKAIEHAMPMIAPVAVKIGAAIGTGIIEGFTQSMEGSMNQIAGDTWGPVITSGINSALPALGASKKSAELWDYFVGGDEKKSHYSGLNRVPRNGYRPITHKDEMIVPAGPAETLRKYGLPNAIRTLEQEDTSSPFYKVSQSGIGSRESFQLTYAPVIQGGNPSEIEQILREDKKNLEQQLKDSGFQQRRVSFAN
ncbi:phage tail tape measure protein [Brevibacillus porteri]|uniref:phage tail tape measure protein n=1 Tax=Brevibacillus porteri TaxID=2126350 RepID=UPI003D22D6AD